MIKEHATGELFSRSECEEYFRAEVRTAGGAKKWLRKHKLTHRFDHCLHMIENGSYFTHPEIMRVLGASSRSSAGWQFRRLALNSQQTSQP